MCLEQNVWAAHFSTVSEGLPEKEETHALVEAATVVIVEDIRLQVYNLTEYTFT